MSQDRRDIKDEIVRLRLLPLLSIDLGGEVELFGIRDDVCRYQNRSNGCELVKGLRIAVLASRLLRPLPESRRDVVANCVAQDIRCWIFVVLKIFAVFSNDNGKLALR